MLKTNDIIRSFDFAQNSGGKDLAGKNANYIIAKVHKVDGDVVTAEIIQVVWEGRVECDRTGEIFKTRLTRKGESRLGNGIDIL